MASSEVMLAPGHGQSDIDSSTILCASPARPVFFNGVDELLVGRDLLYERGTARVVDKLEDPLRLIIRESAI